MSTAFKSLCKWYILEELVLAQYRKMMIKDHEEPSWKVSFYFTDKTLAARFLIAIHKYPRQFRYLLVEIQLELFKISWLHMLGAQAVYSNLTYEERNS